MTVSVNLFPMKTTSDPTLNLIELFASVQGETSLSGLPTTFVRLARCNLRCSWCDTTYSFGKGEPYSLASILEKITNNRTKQVCITGGEPLLQDNIYPLMTELCNREHVVSIETGGSLTTEKIDPRVRIILDIKCPGSGMHEKNFFANLDTLRPHDEVKYVLADRNDYEYAKEISERHKLFDKVENVLFSPVHGVLDPKELVSWILDDALPVRLNLQIHKFIWTPTTQGV